MTTVLILLVALALIVNGAYVVNLVRHDGGARAGRRTPPRSHRGDGFEPPRRFA